MEMHNVSNLIITPGFYLGYPNNNVHPLCFFINLKNDVGNLVYFRLFGCWSLVFGPTACASLACQRAAAAANRGASGWDCGWGSEHVVTTSWLSVLGLRIRISCARTRMLFLFMPNKQLSKSVPETVPERKGEPQTTHCGTQLLQDGCFFSLLSSNLYLHVPRAVWQVAEEGVFVRIHQWCPVRMHIEEPWRCHIKFGT